MRTSWWSRNLDAAGRALFPLRVVVFAALVPLQLRLRKLPNLHLWLEPRGKVLPPPPAPEEISALVRRVDRLISAGRPVVRGACLTRGLTLYWFLRRAGADVSLRFGAGSLRGRFAAHCWLVYQGEPLMEKKDPREDFTETWRIEPDQPLRSDVATETPHGASLHRKAMP
ncbi:MAG TPA: lasso peptide biosynthesis B2 protein [Thermoanaerobaculia bacterium]|nr:lasso peptide biosynthesis B2 protein [Thermoanaerobaculia bacterium]